MCNGLLSGKMFWRACNLAASATVDKTDKSGFTITVLMGAQVILALKLNQFCCFSLLHFHTYIYIDCGTHYLTKQCLTGLTFYDTAIDFCLNVCVHNFVFLFILLSNFLLYLNLLVHLFFILPHLKMALRLALHNSVVHVTSRRQYWNSVLFRSIWRWLY